MIDPRAKHAGGLVGISGAQRRTFRRHAFLFSAECAADAGYLVRNGQVRCFLLEADGRETTTAILGPGQFVGLAALVGHAAHQQFCEALTQVEAWSVPADKLRRSCANSQLIQGWLLGCVGRRLELALTLRRGTALFSAAERADDMRVRLKALAGLDPRNVRQASLASLLQIRPETLARAHPMQARSPLRRAAGQQTLGMGRHEFGARQSILNGDLPEGCIGTVVSGQIELSVTASGSRTVVVETLQAGDVFGFASLLHLPGVPYRIVGLAEGAIVVTPGIEFLDHVAASTTSGQTVIRLAERLEGIERQLARAALPHVGDRLAHVLREVAMGDGKPAGERAPYIPAGWSHVALARHLGVCRETVTRSLATLVKAGVIARQGRRIVMLSEGRGHPAGLERDHSASSPTEGAYQPMLCQPENASSQHISCTVRDSDADQGFVLKTVENLHRGHLSNVERVKTIEHLAASGLGVREISRRTGFNASTISRWLRVNSRPELKKALEDNRLDIARAVILVDAPAPAVSSLIQQAPAISTAELRRKIAAIKTGTRNAVDNDRYHLANALRSLRTVRSSIDEPLMVQTLQRELDRISGRQRHGDANATRTRTA